MHIMEYFPSMAHITEWGIAANTNAIAPMVIFNTSQELSEINSGVYLTPVAFS